MKHFTRARRQIAIFQPVCRHWRFTLLTESGQTHTVEGVVSAHGRYTIDVAGTFPQARNSRFSVLVESVAGTAPLVVERASYSSTASTPWAAGTNSLALPLP